MKLIESMNFVTFYEKIKEQKMPMSLAYKLSKLYRKSKEDETFYQEKLREILYKYGELDEQGNLIPIDDGKGIKIKPDQQTECLADINELQDTISDIQFDPLTLDELKDLEVAPSDIEGIIEFIA